MSKWIVVVGVLAVAGCSTIPETPPSSALPAQVVAADALSRDVDAFVAAPALFPENATEATANCDRYLGRIAEARAALESETGPATFPGTFRRFDDLTLLIGAASSDADLVTNTHVEKDVRDAAQACSQRVSDAMTGASLSRPIYDRLKAIDPASGDESERFLLARAIRDYEAAGVDRDAETRAAITALEEQITAASLTFGRNINDGRLVITARPDELDGLPADYIAAHPPGEDGLVRISTDYPDLAPVMAYARNEGLRRRLFETNLNRAPANEAVLADLLARRYELSRLLGQPDFAHRVTADKMIGSPANARAFIQTLSQVAETPGRRDAARMAARLAAEGEAVGGEAGGGGVPAWSANYAQQLLRKEDYDVDPQEVRQYFAYDNVRDGIFRLTQDLFGVEIRPWQTQVWAPGVEAFEMYENGRLIGRFFLDNHPRDGKYNHAAVFPIRPGLTGRAVPVATLLCNFPAGDHSTGLMEHRDVETFLHEFGHLLHFIFAGEQSWTQQNPFMGLEWDFVEAPSQMLENWVWDYETLSLFAVNAEGQVIPRDLVERMNRARGFGEGYGDRRQMGLAAVSLDLHTGAPPADLTQAFLTSYNRYALSPLTEDTRMQNSFGHLSGYSAIYYTYLWSKTISSDLFTAFEANGLRDVDTARRYRERVLAPGSSRPAATLVEDFLGRPVSLDAYRTRLTREP